MQLWCSPHATWQTETLPPSCPGALPPDLSLVVLGREGEDDYVFSILTGYFDPPEGVEVREGMAYNPYFPGGVIGMPQQLFLDSVEYDDGKTAQRTPLTRFPEVRTPINWMCFLQLSICRSGHLTNQESVFCPKSGELCSQPSIFLPIAVNYTSWIQRTAHIPPVINF